MNCLYTIPLCNFGFAFRHATRVIVKDFGKTLLKTKSSPIFFSYKLSERKPLFKIAQCTIKQNETYLKNQIRRHQSCVFLPRHIYKEQIHFFIFSFLVLI